MAAREAVGDRWSADVVGMTDTLLSSPPVRHGALLSPFSILTVCIWAVILYISPGLMSTYGSVEPTMPSPARRDSGLVANRGALSAVARFGQRTYALDYVGLLALITGYFMVCLSM